MSCWITSPGPGEAGQHHLQKKIHRTLQDKAVVWMFDMDLFAGAVGEKIAMHQKGQGEGFVRREIYPDAVVGQCRRAVPCCQRNGKGDGAAAARLSLRM